MPGAPSSVLAPSTTCLVASGTLFRSISNGVTWGHAADSLEQIGMEWVQVFHLYVAFCSFALLNVMTGPVVAAELCFLCDWFLWSHVVSKSIFFLSCTTPLLPSFCQVCLFGCSHVFLMTGLGVRVLTPLNGCFCVAPGVLHHNRMLRLCWVARSVTGYFAVSPAV